ncbi:putative polyketide synthase [Xylaria grammica]|nr:putative polyketide synthase [Xylaria grammica]
MCDSSGLDGKDMNDVAICGFSIKFPQDATSPESFWKMIEEKRCASIDFPLDRLNPDGFHTKKKKLNSLPLRGGHFIKEDLAVFDADFFSISPTEATAMDPMQRWLLETSFGALENAGIQMQQVSGSSTAVYTGSFNMDYMLQLNRDPEAPPTYAAVGFGLSMLANRISWFFNLRGPSIGLDSACSSTAMAIDIACQALRNRSCDMSMVAGCNLATSPESYIWMSNINFLSPDSRCYSFDHRANGYARGEGIAVLILKRLSDAIRDGNTIRAIIRATGSNEDGRTPGITQPSATAQTSLIRETYKRAHLSMEHTRYFEAHGTGTPIGDPIEAQAIGTAFQGARSCEDPVYVGAVKSNIGHLEGASGLAAVIKTVLVLEKAVIPPNANFEKINPKIDSQFLNLRFPRDSIPWPTSGLRRASISSFGYGGSNSHVVLDDAYNYLRLRNLVGKHWARTLPPRNASSSDSLAISHSPLHESVAIEASHPTLLIFSAADENGTARISKGYEAYYVGKGSPEGAVGLDILRNLAFTLDTHRSHLSWRSYVVLRSPMELSNLTSSVTSSVRAASKAPRLGFVFSGQGAQWYAMGRELLCYTPFQAELESAGHYLETLGCSWSVLEELSRPKDQSNVDDPEYSQTLCSVLQLAVVKLLDTFGIKPSSVVGHSSGEIAAAYAAGYLCRESAWKLAYLRGRCASELVKQSTSQPGSMLSVGLSEDRARQILSSLDPGKSYGVSLACVNSPSNVTVAGERQLIDQLVARLEDEQVFCRRLHINLAYHSRQMDAISEKYADLIGQLSAPSNQKSHTPMISSVTGEHVFRDKLLDPSYWVANMVSTVNFCQAVTKMCAQSAIHLIKKIDRSHVHSSVVDHLVEIGPHAVLQGPLREILRVCPRGKLIGYCSILRRNQSASETMLQALGELYSIGVAPLNIRAVNEPDGPAKPPPSLLVDLPQYPFDHSQRYWHESRLSRNYRLRSHAPLELLGARSRDWNAHEARWRHFIRLAELPWVEQHTINGTIIYPGAGMLAMVIEATKQLTLETVGADCINGYTLRNIQLESPMDFTANHGILEVQTLLRQIRHRRNDDPRFEFVVSTYSRDEWLVNCRGTISVNLSRVYDEWVQAKTEERNFGIADALSRLATRCVTHVESQYMYRFLQQCGYDYGPVFQAAKQQRYNHTAKEATAQVDLFDSAEDDHVIHPVSLDAILHLVFTAVTGGGSRLIATSIPSRIGCMWVSGDGLSYPLNQAVTACTFVTSMSARGFFCNGAALDAKDPGKLRLWYEGLELTNVTATPPSFSLPNPKQYYMNVDCKVAVSKLSHKEMEKYLNDLHPVKQNLTVFFAELEGLITSSLRQLTSSINPTSLCNQESWKAKYYDWAVHHLAKSGQSGHHTRQPLSESNQSFIQACKRMKQANKVGRLYAQVALSLVDLFEGETDSLELLLLSGLLKDYYEELADYRHADQAASYIDLLAHEVPGMRILEVGGGTASATRNITKALRSQSDDPTSPLRCSRYDFTDVSLAFLDSARKEFSSLGSQMTFGILDIERSFADQGFQEGAYDIVIADNVLHVTFGLSSVLQHVRKALKTGRKLIFHELLKPSGWTAGFVFGVFPGWWRGDQDGRLLSPNITVDAWDELLKQNGFSGVDIVFKDFEDDTAHHLGWIVTTAIDEKSSLSLAVNPPKNTSVAIIVNEDCPRQSSIARSLSSPIRDIFGLVPQVQSLDSAVLSTPIANSNDFVILLLDYGSSFVQSFNETTWSQMQSIVRRSRQILWVSGGGGRGAEPSHGLLDGLARTLRSEFYELHLVTLALQESSAVTDKAFLVTRVMNEMLGRSSRLGYEQEYLEIDGRLHIRRLVEARYLKIEMDAKLAPHQSISMPLSSKFPFQVSVESPGHQGNLRFIEASPPLATTMANDDVDVLLKAVALPPHSPVFSLSSSEGADTGRYFSGVILQSGANTLFSSGERVIAVCTGSLRSHVRVSSSSVMKILPTLSYSDACWVIPPRIAAYHALIAIGNVKPEDSVIIDDGASLLGQACLQLLVDKKVQNSWAIASNEAQSIWISENYRIPPKRVLPKSWFDEQSILFSSSKLRFDVAVSFTVGPSASLLMNHMELGGRYILLCPENNTPNKSFNVSCTPENVSVSVLSLKRLVLGNIMVNSSSLEYAVSDSYKTILKDTKQRIPQISAPELIVAFNQRQISHNTDTAVVNFNEHDVIDVKVSKKPTYDMNPQATYIIAGGLGGLGRAMANWLASRGARYLILLSRSGPKTSQAKAFLTQLREKCIRVETPRCDVANLAMLRDVLAKCMDTMPPIKGCVQASVVLTELIYQKMNYNDWRTAISPKVEATWNLYMELPKDLDFFILVSSMMGILGSGSLAAYNAGNTYQDAFAKYLVSQGRRAISLDLGAVVDGGHLVEHTYHIGRMGRTKKFELTYVKELCSLLDIYCDPKTPLATDPTRCQAIVGIRAPSHWKHLEEVPTTMEQPFWGHLHHIPPLPSSDKQEENNEHHTIARNIKTLDMAKKLASAATISEAAEIITEALANRVSILLGTLEERIDRQKPMHSYGLDSLSALDLRNWIGKMLDVDMPVFEILGDTTFSSAGVSIAQKRQVQS